jgi:hypothetical protein
VEQCIEKSIGKCIGLCVAIMTLILSVFSIAQRLEKLTPEQQASKLKPSATHRLSGTVTMRPDNHPVAKAGISIIRFRGTTGERPFTERTMTDEQGRWSIDNLPDGVYSIIIVPGRTFPPIGGNVGQKSELISQFVTQKTKLEIHGADIDDIDSQVNKGGRITGRVVMDGGEPIPEELIVVPRATIESDDPPMQNVQVNPDGSFDLEGVPNGEIHLKAIVFNKQTQRSLSSDKSFSITLVKPNVTHKNIKFLLNQTIRFCKQSTSTETTAERCRQFPKSAAESNPRRIRLT